VPVVVDSVGEVKRINIAEPSFTYDETEPDGSRSGSFRFGSLLDAEELRTAVRGSGQTASLAPTLSSRRPVRQHR